MSSSAVIGPGLACCVTGGASGIGLSIALRCAASGMSVCIADADAARLPAAEAALEAAGAAAVLALECDVSSLESMQSVQEAVFARFGGCSFLALNAGIGGGGGVLAAESRWRALLDVNLLGPALGLQAFLQPMQASGRPGVVSITGSREGITTPPSDIVYNASKAAVRVLAESLEHQLRSTPGEHLQQIARKVPKFSGLLRFLFPASTCLRCIGPNETQGY
jgi:NAD(P)-dependent dehydrogenase (short-subunit alcohol dehydrogenase family)